MNATTTFSDGGLGPIEALMGQVDRIGTGTYLLTGAEERIGKSGTAYLRVVLEDASGTMPGFVWPEHRDKVALPTLPAVVSVHGCVKVFDHKPHLRVERLAGASTNQVSSATALLPRHRCPQAAREGLRALAKAEAVLPAPLDDFLKRVLLDPTITLPLLRCRASVAHHHAFPGGLLAHSTQMMDLAAELASRVLPDDLTAPAMAQLGMLLHDIGKLRTVGETRRPFGALVIRHEFVSIELLAPHLRWLEQQEANLAFGLRYILTYLATPKKSRPIAEYAVAEIVERLDELSAAGHHCQTLDGLLRRESRKVLSSAHPDSSPRGQPKGVAGR